MNEGEMTIPHLFRCPISLDLLEDPVTLCTGQTYDRSSIEKWLSQGNLTCPVTMQKLHDLSIVPNHTLRHLIHHWLQFHHHHLLPPPSPSSAIDDDSLSSLKHTLLHSSSLIHKLQALHKITLFSHEFCSFHKSRFLQLGFLPLLLDQVFHHHHHCDDPINEETEEFIDLALSCILKLIPLDPTSQSLRILTQGPKFQTLLLLIEKGSTRIKTSLCNLVDSASSSSEDICNFLGKSQKLVQEIVLTLLQIQSSELSSKAAMKAMAALCRVESNRENLIEAGAIDGIMRYISVRDRDFSDEKKMGFVIMGMEMMEKLVGLERGKEGLMVNCREKKGMETLVRMVFRVMNVVEVEECSEKSVGLLMIVCKESGRAREEAIGEGVLTQLLLLLQSQCSVRTKTKARMLLKLLRAKWGE